jgi:hypothetical protein
VVKVKFFTLLGIRLEPHGRKPVSSRYTDCAILGPRIKGTTFKSRCIVEFKKTKIIAINTFSLLKAIINELLGSGIVKSQSQSHLQSLPFAILCILIIGIAGTTGFEAVRVCIDNSYAQLLVFTCCR